MKGENIRSVKKEIERCHWGNVKVFESQGVTIFGGGMLRGANPLVADIVIDLAGNVEAIQAPLGWRVTKYAKPIVRIPIEDFGAPELPAVFWHDLWADLVEHPGHVLICCGGGHGRTGMVLAILACVAGVVPEEEDPVEWVRKRYCINAVETLEQINYISSVTGRKVNAKPVVGKKLGAPHTGWWEEIWK